MTKLYNYQEYLRLNAREIDKLDYKNKINFLRYLRKDYEKYDLRQKIAPQTKAKINRDIDELLSYANVAGAKIFTPRKKNLNKALDFAGQSKKWKKAIITVTDGESLVLAGNEYATRSKFWNKRKIKFNKNNLANNPEKEISRVLKERKFDTSNIITGTSVLGGMATPADIDLLPDIIEEVKNLMNMYGNEEANNFYMNWLEGLFIYDFINQESYEELLAARRKLKNAKKKNRRRRL